jgi:hypothetical protein
MEQVSLSSQVSKGPTDSIGLKHMAIKWATSSVFWAASLILLLSAPSISSVPSGVGQAGNEGCICHGGASVETVVKLEGLPAVFESNTTYNLSIEIQSSIDSLAEQHQGGFRLIIKGGGTVLFEDLEEVQYLEEGWTHQSNGTYQRTWNLTWTSPNNSTDPMEFTLIGIAHVDGPPVEQAPMNQTDIDAFDQFIFAIGILALAYFLLRTLK